MFFASPLWLLGLLPWAGVTIWLLLGRRQRVGVPFIKLWRGQTRSPRAKPSLTRPPLPILLAILSLLLAVLASAGPMLPSRIGPVVTIIVDRGITMSARGQYTARFKETCDRLAGPLREATGSGPVQVICVPAGKSVQLDRTNWTGAVAPMTPTLQNSRSALIAAIHRWLAESAGDLIVITDQPVPADPRVIQIEPERPVSNLTIADVAARATPRPQVMVVLRDQGNATDFRHAHVRVESDGNVGTQDLQIPRDGNVTAFIDLPAVGTVVWISVDAPDDLPADNQAWLAREQSWARIEDSPALPEPLRRMIAVYRRHRDSGGRRIDIVTDYSDSPADEPAIVVASDALPASPSALHVESHPLTANVDWAAATSGALGGTPPPGWRPIVSKGSAVFLAVRDEPARGVWVCLNSPIWPTQADYVVFWTNAFDWVGGEDVYRWHPLAGHEPGIETQSDGSKRAYNAIDVIFPPVRPNDWSQLRSFAMPTKTGADLTSPLCFIALVLMAVAIVAMTTN